MMSIEKICKNCKHWKFKQIKLFGKVSKSFGQCKRLSVEGFKTFTAYDGTCEDDINAFKSKYTE